MQLKADIAFPSFLARLRQHAGRKIYGGNPCSSPSHANGMTAGSATEIEDFQSPDISEQLLYQGFFQGRQRIRIAVINGRPLVVADTGRDSFGKL